ncbi:MAG: hypothetical protein AB2A00_16420 [Myxococcota bacterium]
MTAGLAALALLAGCSGVPAGLPGTATCQVGRSQRTVRCDEICAEADSARSETERNELRQCAADACGQSCE